jgi:hypothetical protein
MSKKVKGIQPSHVLNALLLASPFALALRYEGLAHCAETSISAVRALQHWGVAARAVPCGIVGWGPQGNFSCGLKVEEIRDWLRSAQGHEETPEEASAFDASVIAARTDGRFQTNNTPFHMMVAVKSTFLDLTLGQIQHVAGIPVPLQARWKGPDWPSFGAGEWNLNYLPLSASRNKEVGSVVSVYQARGHAEDLQDLMQLALSCNCDTDRFFETLERNLPQEYSRAVSRCGEWSRLGLT